MRRAAVMVLIAGLLGAVPALLLARSPAAARPAPPRVARRMTAIPRPGQPVPAARSGRLRAPDLPAPAVPGPPSRSCYVAGGCSETPCVQFIGAAGPATGAAGPATGAAGPAIGAAGPATGAAVEVLPTAPSFITPGHPRATPCARYPDRSDAGPTIVPRERIAPPAPPVAPVAPGRLMPVAPQSLITLADRALARRMAARPRP
jgi:hypothetical protein